jgi:hypothetical protein
VPTKSFTGKLLNAGNPTKTRILSEFAGFLLSVSFGIDRFKPDVLAYR